MCDWVCRLHGESIFLHIPNPWSMIQRQNLCIVNSLKRSIIQFMTKRVICRFHNFPHGFCWTVWTSMVIIFHLIICFDRLCCIILIQNVEPQIMKEVQINRSLHFNVVGAMDWMHFFIIYVVLRKGPFPYKQEFAYPTLCKLACTCWTIRAYEFWKVTELLLLHVWQSHLGRFLKKYPLERWIIWRLWTWPLRNGKDLRTISHLVWAPAWRKPNLHQLITSPENQVKIHWFLSPCL